MLTSNMLLDWYSVKESEKIDENYTMFSQFD